MTAQCPACKSPRSVPGRLMIDGSEQGWTTRFYPRGLRFLTFKRSVAFARGEDFSACLACGHVWNTVDPHELMALLLGSGDNETLATIQRDQPGGPTRDG